jgi:hypothetical protein
VMIIISGVVVLEYLTVHTYGNQRIHWNAMVVFKMSLTKAKDAYLNMKEKRNIPQSFRPSDVIPLINMAWRQSLSKKENAMKAIVERVGMY